MKTCCSLSHPAMQQPQPLTDESRLTSSLKQLALISLVALLTMAPVSQALAEKKQVENNNPETISWSYADNTGPAHWGDLNAEYATCKNGKNQSPVDIKEARDVNLKPIKFDYEMLVPSRIVNDGRSVHVEMWSGGKIELDGTSFTLKQINFHTPSEHTVHGKHFPLEAQFVHQSEDNELAIIAILYVPGKPNSTISRLWEKLPVEQGKSERLGAYELKTIEIKDELKHYYYINGSLTTPPCTEGVRWIIMKQPYTVSRQQVEKLQQALGQPNNRPVQPLNARVIMD